MVQSILILLSLCCLILPVLCDLSPCPSFEFFEGVTVICVSFPDAPRDEHYLRVESKNMKDFSLVDDNDGFTVNIHFHTPAVGHITLSDVAKYNPNELVGVALDGVPIYSSLVDIGIDGLAPDLSTGVVPIMLDQCGGVYGPTGTELAEKRVSRYHYRAMPACILDTSDTYNRRRTKIEDIHELLDYFEVPGPHLIGYSVAGKSQIVSYTVCGCCF